MPRPGSTRIEYANFEAGAEVRSKRVKEEILLGGTGNDILLGADIDPNMRAERARQGRPKAAPQGSP